MYIMHRGLRVSTGGPWEIQWRNRWLAVKNQTNESGHFPSSLPQSRSVRHLPDLIPEGQTISLYNKNWPHPDTLRRLGRLGECLVCLWTLHPSHVNPGSQVLQSPEWVSQSCMPPLLGETPPLSSSRSRPTATCGYAVLEHAAQACERPTGTSQRG